MRLTRILGFSIAALLLLACSGKADSDSSSNHSAGGTGASPSGGASSTSRGGALGIAGNRTQGGSSAQGGTGTGGEWAAGGHAPSTSSGGVGVTTQGGTPAIGGSVAQAGSSPNGGTRAQGGTGTGGEWAAGGHWNVGGVTQSDPSSNAGKAAGGMTGSSVAGQAGMGAAAGAGNQPFECASSNCCVPLTLDGSAIRINQIGGNVLVSAVVEHLDNNRDLAAWDVTLEVTAPWGQTVTCTASVSSLSYPKFIALTCPPLQPSSAVSCGSTAAFKFRLGSKLSNLTSCGAADSRLEFGLALPVNCPTCPSPSSQPQGSCDYPSSQTCSYTALMYPGTGYGSLPCYCRMDSSTGTSRWSCAVS